MTAHAAAKLPPPTAALGFWSIGEHRKALAKALAVVCDSTPPALSRSAFLEQMEQHFYSDPNASTRMKDALGRLLRDKGAKATSPETLHWILVTLFYVYQAHLSQETRIAVDAVFRSEKLFRMYETELRKAGFPPLVTFTDFDLKGTSYGGSGAPEPPVQPKDGLAEIPPLETVLRLLNVRNAMHALANEFFFQIKPYALGGYERCYYVLITKPPEAQRPHLSLLVLRSGTAADAALTYTHYQRDRRGAQRKSNGVVCPSLNGYTLFGGFGSGEAMENLFIPQREQSRDKLRGEICSLDPSGLAYRGEAFAVRSTDLLWDDQPPFTDQNLASCPTLAAHVEERDLVLSATLM